jgi:hypothetical protein
MLLAQVMECDLGKYGEHCESTCHCLDNQCDRTSGECKTACAAGWTDYPRCQISKIFFSTQFKFLKLSSTLLKQYTNRKKNKEYDTNLALTYYDGSFSFKNIHFSLTNISYCKYSPQYTIP